MLGSEQPLAQVQRTSVVRSGYSEARFGQANGRTWSGSSASHLVAE